MTDDYDELRELSPDERLQVMIHYLSGIGDNLETKIVVVGLQNARTLIQPDGWQHLAPSWVRAWKETA